MEYKVTVGAYIYKGEPVGVYPKDMRANRNERLKIEKGSILYGVDNGDYMELRMFDDLEMRGQHIPMSDLEKYDGDFTKLNGAIISKAVAKMLVDYGNDVNAMKNFIMAIDSFFHKPKKDGAKYSPVLLRDQFSDETLNALSEMLFDEIQTFFEKNKKEE